MVICKFCKDKYPNHRELVFHCELDHAEQYTKVMGWLDKTVVPKITVLEKLAAEGMKGPSGDD